MRGGRTTVWVVNRDHWPRAYLRAELLERGYDATGFETLRDAAVSLVASRRPPPALLILDVQSEAVDAELLASLAGRGIRILVVAGVIQPDVEGRDSIVEVLRRPLTIGEIADAVERWTSSRKPNPAGASP